MKKIGFVIIDEQNNGEEFRNGEIFRNKKEVIKTLVSYHSIDWTGEDDNGNEITLEEKIKQFKTIQEKLEFLLDYGVWGIQRRKFSRRKKND